MELRGLLTLLLATRALAHTTTLPFNSTVASAYSCPSACQTALAEGIRADDAVFSPSPVRNASFFRTASNFSDSRPGQLLKFEKITDLASYDFTNTLPAGITLYAIQYTSVAFNGTKVPVTGFVALPFVYADSSSDRFPLVSFAHGTSGFSPNCAPSKSNNFYDYFSWTPLLLAGMAVVATDYAGLGNSFTHHPYVAATVNSNDVFYAVQAAKAALPDKLSSQWAAVGHSQGGGAVYALTENDLVHGSGFLGAVAISPSARVYDLLTLAATSSSSASDGAAAQDPALGYLTLLNWALQTAFPAVNVTSFLSNVFGHRCELAQKLDVCIDGAGALATGLTEVDLFSATGGEKWLALLRKFQHLYGAGTGRPAHAPLLIVQSKGDQTVPYKASELSYNSSCAAGNDVQLALVPLVDHSATPSATSGLWLLWLKERFAGKSVDKKCAMKHEAAVDASAAYAPLDSQGY